MSLWLQAKVKEGIQQCEKAVHMVNQLHLFSDNELIEEVATADMRWDTLRGKLVDVNILYEVFALLEVNSTAKLFTE